MVDVVMSPESESYLVFCRFENGSVLIDRILHSRQDYVSILLGNMQEEFENDF
jgi:plasmid stabilization system protein ParE